MKAEYSFHAAQFFTATIYERQSISQATNIKQNKRKPSIPGKCKRS